jgi:hypothetical protein
MTRVQELEKSEVELLLALAQIRDAKKRALAKEAATLGHGAELLRKQGNFPLQIDVAGRLFQRQPDGSYREVVEGSARGNAVQNTRDNPRTSVPQPIAIPGTGGGRAAAEVEDAAVKMILRTRVLGHVTSRPVR